MSADRFLHPRDQAQQCMARIYGYRMTTTSGGNVSVRDDDGNVWITPARLDKGTLTREHIVCVRPDGSLDGPAPPSSELPLHQAVYAARPDVRAIVHAHPVALVAFSVVGRVPDTRVLHQAHRICGEGGFAPYRLPGSVELGVSVAGALAAGHDCVILENHGVVTVGGDVGEAFRRFETFEFAGKTIVKAALLGEEPRRLGDDDLAVAARQPRLEIRSEHVVPTNSELELRAMLRDFVRRGYRQRLFISTHGTFSARVGGDSFVITPHHVDRAELDASDFVLVAGGRVEPGSPPSHAAALHAAIYRLHPEIGAIVNAAPVNATAFGICGAVPDTRTIPESRLVVRSPVAVPFRLQFEDPQALAALVSPQQPAVVLENDGVLVAGRDVLEAFDRLEVLESTAEALLNARPLGPLAPMSDAVIDELETAFGI
jgi:L-fuculose-phosphate aldolase